VSRRASTGQARGPRHVSHGIFRTTGLDKDGKPLDLTLRVIDVYRKINGLVIHELVSWPVDLATVKADLISSEP
jgi:hypothetical protein